MSHALAHDQHDRNVDNGSEPTTAITKQAVMKALDELYEAAKMRKTWALVEIRFRNGNCDYVHVQQDLTRSSIGGFKP